jgi:pilus assembly protein CpaF
MAALRDQIALWGKSRNLQFPTPQEFPSYTAPQSMEESSSGALPLSSTEAVSVSRVKSPRGMSAGYYATKIKLHQAILTRIDLVAAESMPGEQLREQLRILANRLIDEATLPVNEHERATLVTDLQNEILGLGPLEPLLADPTISEILVNGAETVFVERHGVLELTQIRFSDDEHLQKVIDRIVSRVGRRIDESSPMVDARLPDGSRVNAIIPPLALDGPVLSIRRFAVVPLHMNDLIQKNALTTGMAELLSGLVKAKVNILISGGTGSGKTTLLNILSSFIPGAERIITIEDTAELQLQQSHVVRLETRPPNIEGKGEITMRALVRNSLRMRPDRIVLGEVRGAEAFDMLQAMNTGHDGSLTTIHANTARDAIGRLENLIGMAGVNLPPRVIRQQICSAIRIVVQTARLNDGSRRIISIQEITGMEGDVISTQEIFFYERQGMSSSGTVIGRFCATGIRPFAVEKMSLYGITLSANLFDPLRSPE